jgi:hypothetical protein
MKNILLSLLLMVFSAPAFAGPAHHHRHHHGYHHGNHWNHSHAGRWIAPVIIGGAIGYALAQPTIVQPAPMIVQQPLQPTETYLNCTEWKEVMQPNGTIIRERYCR